MPIPYEVKSLMPGKVQIKSDFLKYIHVSEEAIEKFLRERKGALKVKASRKTGRVTIYYDPEEFDLIEFFQVLDNADSELIIEIVSGAEKDISKETKEKETGAKRWFMLNTLAFIPFLFRTTAPTSLFASLTLALAMPVFRKAFEGLRKAKFNVHLLDSSAIVLSTWQKNHISSMLMLWLLSLGDVIEEKTQATAHKEIEKLFCCKEEQAWLVTEDGNAVKVAAEELKRGDEIVVYTGEKITIDGRVEKGEGLVNQSSLTGEPNPVLKKKGDKVYAGTFLEDGKLYIRVEKVGDETALAKIVRILEESVNEPIERQKKAEELANKFVIPTFLTAGAAYIATSDLTRLTSTLIIDYHTGIHVSTPTAVMSHMALAAKKGILFKSGRHLEILHNADAVVFDKTGTLTLGRPELTEIITYEVSEEEALLYVASLEQRLLHPVAKSIVHEAEKRALKLLPRKQSKYHMGLGIEGRLGEDMFFVGSTKFMEKKKIPIPKRVRADVDKLHERGESVLYLVKNKTIIALFGIRDPIRPEAKEVVETLYKLGREVILCTGDNRGAAKQVAQQLGIERYYGRAFPDEKVKIIKQLKKQGRIIAFLGEGINDSPALSVADIGISIRSGADIAIEVADVVMGDDLRYLIDAIKIADMALRNIDQNYRINVIANTVGLMGSVAGVVSPVMATVINNGVTVLTGINSMKAFWKDTRNLRG